ncbi:ABC transporter ATP-binding protein [Acidihalobacter aeolianus]|uniref:ABC transporter ATP-binding protein n=2 Tax=Acidihalobacter aeolianus TaxID=2792603 RepID=A0A1D8K8Z2_9GAMM|nr:ABC transporter ATP-binding protein [Acidihalobacter aeolianus]
MPPGTLTPTALTVRGLRKTYGELVAVDGVDLEVRHNEIVGLLGPNGAGKTTLINMILGILEPSAGHILIEGADLVAERRQALEQTNFAAIYAPLPGNMTVYQNLRVFGLLYGVEHLRAKLESLIEEFDLQRYRNQKCGVLSSGEQTRVALAKAMLNEPKLLLLDEPTASLDPASAHDIRARLRAFADQRHCGVLWTSHNMYEVAEVCDRVLFISRGRVLLEGNPRDLPRTHGRETLEDLFIHIAREPLSYERETA